MKKVIMYMGLYLALGLYFTGCSSNFEAELTPIGSAPSFEDPYIIVDRVQVLIQGDAHGFTAKMTKPNKFNLLVPQALAYNGSVAPSATLTAITYNNPATVVGFTLSSTALTAGSFTGDILSFGNFSVSGLDDNKLKVCPATGEANGGNTKCNRAKIRVYSATGDANGVFQNTTDGYYIPLLVEGMPVGVGVANAAYVQTLTIAGNKNRLRASDFTSANPNFPVTMDFSNGGAGSYSATLIVEYVLIKE
jgi:hypothetical protein